MRSVAASKLKTAEKQKDLVQPFILASSNLLKDLPAAPEGNVKQVYCTVTSDRGLCGSANTGIIRTVIKETKPISKENLEFYCIGDKSRAGLSREYRNEVTFTATNLDKKTPTFREVSRFAERLVATPVEKLTITSNRFINPIVFQVNTRVFPSKDLFMKNIRKSLKGYDLGAHPKQTAQNLYDYSIAAIIYGSVIENIACELSARMAAMDNATKNANDMAQKLNLDFNRKRQAGITKELTEIVSGAAAVEEGGGGN